MFVTLIPLFLLAKMNLHQSDWKYGPEVIYDVNVESMSQSSGIESHVDTKLSWITKLKCREKSRLILSCQLYHLQIDMDDPEKKWNNSTDGHFELHFGHGGVEKIICSSLLQPALIDTIRTVSDQLNLGADLSKTSGDIFDIMENSTTGECKTGFILSSYHVNVEDADSSSSSSSESDEDDTNNCEIVIEPGQQTPSSEMRAIKKNRHLNECLRQYRHVFAIMQDASSDFIGSPVDTPVKYLIEQKFVSNSMQFESSESQMTIRDNSFTSYTQKKFITSNNTYPVPIRLTEVITLKLEKIVAANGPLPSIQHPSSISIFPERWIHISGDNNLKVEDTK